MSPKICPVNIRHGYNHLQKRKGIIVRVLLLNTLTFLIFFCLLVEFSRICVPGFTYPGCTTSKVEKVWKLFIMVPFFIIITTWKFKPEMQHFYVQFTFTIIFYLKFDLTKQGDCISEYPSEPHIKSVTSIER